MPENDVTFSGKSAGTTNVLAVIVVVGVCERPPHPEPPSPWRLDNMTDFMHHGQEPASYPETEPRTDPDFAMLRAQALDRVPEQQRSNTVVIPGTE